MSVRVVLPAEIVPSIFLAGPIRGARDWQIEVIDYFKEMNRKHEICDVDIYNPRLYDIFKSDGVTRKFSQLTQTTWETRMLNKADIIAFYLPLPLDVHNSNYARATRIELGEWLARHKVLHKKMIVCAEIGFSGADYIKDKCNEYGVNLLITYEDYIYELIKSIREVEDSYATGYKHS